LLAVKAREEPSVPIDRELGVPKPNVTVRKLAVGDALVPVLIITSTSLALP
jgi:hypothetical protein